MSKFRQQLPQLGERRFLTDSGLETDLIFNDGFTLPDFAAFVLLDEEAGRLGLDAYFRRHVQLALDVGVGIVLETPTWRANSDWGTRLGYDATSLKEANCEAVELLLAIREGQGDDGPPVVISGNVGPRAASYSATIKMTADQAFDYHAQQVGILAATEVDLVSALTIAYTDEAIGIARAAITSDVPSVISFTVETDGQLPDGMSVNDAIVAVDGATGAAPAYYMVNCAHPTHLARSFPDEAISPRLRRAEWVAVFLFG